MKYFLTVSLLVVSIKLTGFGIADWQHDTPGGNVMDDPGDGTHLTIRRTGEKLSGITKWYFYKDFIVGEFYDGFFIVDEGTGDKLIFQDKDKWTKEIQSRGLEPAFWTRWYQDNWVDGDWLLIWLYFGFVFAIPFILFFIFALFWAIARERFNLTRPFTLLVLSIVIIIGTTLLLDHHPGSI